MVHLVALVVAALFQVRLVLADQVHPAKDLLAAQILRLVPIIVGAAAAGQAQLVLPEPEQQVALVALAQHQALPGHQ
jgi:hypothetical protein